MSARCQLETEFRLPPRCFLPTGESYAGKYVPSIAHYVLQADKEQPAASAEWLRAAAAARPLHHPLPDAGGSIDRIPSGDDDTGGGTDDGRRVSSADGPSSGASLGELPAFTRQGGMESAPPSIKRPALKQSRKGAVPAAMPRPNFRLRGIAIGNGLTDPGIQIQTLADTCYALGMIHAAARQSATSMQVGSPVLLHVKFEVDVY